MLGLQKTISLLHNLVSCQLVVENDLCVENASARNTNYMVVSARGPNYLLKQGIGADKVATVEREAAVYKLFWQGGVGSGFARYLPRFFDYDPDEHLLILELLPDAVTLWERHARLGRFPVAMATEMGRALALLHCNYHTDKLASVDDLRLPATPIPALSFHKPYLRYINEASAANLKLFEIVQRFSRFGEELDALRAEWQPKCLVHGDIKWDNVLAVRGEHGRTHIKIVDWELARIGEPCWDVGSVFGDYLSFWLASIPITGEEPPDRFLQLARYPISKMQPAMRAFWETYAKGMKLVGEERDEWLLRSVCYTAARLLQSAYEQSFVSQRLTGNVVCLLQLSLNILQRPADAAAHLLGIPLGRDRAA